MKVRLHEIDVLRGLAALCVVLFHYTTHFNNKFGHQDTLLFDMPLGYYGVQLFFIISGFVIYMTLQNTMRPLDFIVSRASRLFPTYWMAVALTFTALSFVDLPGRSISGFDALINLSMIQMLFGIRNVDAVYWTLIYELAFYFIMFTVYVTGYIKKINILCTIWLFIQTTIILSELNGLYFPFKIKFIILFEYCGLFIAGMQFYQVKIRNSSYINHLILLWCVTNVFLMNGVLAGLIILLFFSIFYLFCFDKLKFIVRKPLIFLGVISYSLYLIHLYIGWMFIRYFTSLGVNSNISVLLTITITIAIAAAMTFFVEKPFLLYIRNSYKKYKEVGLNSVS